MVSMKVVLLRLDGSCIIASRVGSLDANSAAALGAEADGRRATPSNRAEEA